MILGEISRTADTAVTLDDLFTRVSVRHPNALAFTYPSNPKILPVAPAHLELRSGGLRDLRAR